MKRIKRQKRELNASVRYRNLPDFNKVGMN